MIKAIFFDLDGVLIDSEVIEHRWTEQFLVENNIPIPPERFLVLVGSHKSHNHWPSIVEGIELPCTVEELKENLTAYKKEKWSHVNYHDLIFPETKKIIFWLKQNQIYVVCASSSNIMRIKMILDSRNLTDLFDLIVTGDDFKASKPEPDIYLYCQKYFNLKSEECLVVEDSPIGITAGKRAGLKVAARKDNELNMDQSQADYFLDNLIDLKELISAINRTRSE